MSKSVIMKAVLGCVFLSLTAAATCPIYTCSDTLAATTCVSWTSLNTFAINSVGCKAGYHCSVFDATTWAKNYSGLGGLNAFYACSVDSTETQGSDSGQEGEWAYVDCYPRDANKGFANGATVVVCQDSSDCLLMDGTKTTCGCTLRPDSFGICDPDPRNEQVFSGYWSDCGSDNQLTDEDAYNYWTLYMQLWRFQQSSLACVEVFREWKMLSDALDAYEFALTFSLGLLPLILSC